MGVTGYLDDTWLAIKHAKDHVSEMELLVQTFFESNPYEMIVEPDTLYPGRKLQYLRLTEPLPYRISGLAADAIRVFRSALDHLGFAAACAVGSNGKHAHFPFGDTVKDVEGRRKGRSKDIPKEIFDFMVARKPYQGGNETLWRLNKLANTNKHEITVSAMLLASNLFYEGAGYQLNTGPRKSVDDKIPIAWLFAGQNKFNDKVKATMTVCFDNVGEITFDKPAVGFLNDCGRVVEGIIRGVEAESRRIKII